MGGSARISTKNSTADGADLFIDTWGWLAIADAGDPAHKAAVAERRRRNRSGSLVTTDYILDETFTRLFSRTSSSQARQFCDAIFQSESGGLLRVQRITKTQFEAAYRMRLRYDDKPGISFTDFTSFIVMQELKIRHVLTADAHFSQVQLGFRRVPQPV
jgi:predicted nucleic acid-binding protein